MITLHSHYSLNSQGLVFFLGLATQNIVRYKSSLGVSNQNLDVLTLFLFIKKQ